MTTPVLAAEPRYETFVRDLADLGGGKETMLVLRDLAPGRRKYFAVHARAVVSQRPDSADGAKPLRVRSMVGNALPGSWYVTIREVLPSRIHGAPYENAFEALRAPRDPAPSAR